MDVESYLARIGVNTEVAPDLQSLEMLQRAHLTAVPFENLDVYYRRGVRTTAEWSVPKIVERRRGGWCFELNGAFSCLLEALGFEVRRLAATVLYDTISPMPTHLTLEVTLDRPYLVDVGFGDSFIRPLPLDGPGPHDGGPEPYGFIFDGQTTTLVSTSDASVVHHYRFERIPVSLESFEEASVYLQTQPGLDWTKGRFATRLIDRGPDRVTLLEGLLKFRHGNEWTEQPLSRRDWPAALDEWFGMTP